VKRKTAKRKDADKPLMVLVVDDSPTIRKIVEICLSRLGIEVRGAAGGEEAAEALKRISPDLVLADARMPAPDGYELCERIKLGEFGSEPPVVLLADVLEPFDTARGASCGADGNVAKPFDATTLTHMVCDQLGIERPAESPRAAPPAGPRPAFMTGPGMGRSADERITASPGTLGAMGLQELRLSDADLDALAKRVLAMISDRVVREVAWEVVPDMSELLIKEEMQRRS